MSDALTPEQVKKVARLARLSLPEEKIEQYRHQLSAVLGYVDRLRELDLEGVEPLANVGDFMNRLDQDVPGSTVSNDALMKMAPDRMAPFIKVPKVLEEGGGA